MRCHICYEPDPINNRFVLPTSNADSASLTLMGVWRLRRFSDAPLVLLIGIPAKRVKETGAPSLKHPFARVFPHCAHFAAGELKVGVVRAFPPATESLPRSARSSWE